MLKRLYRQALPARVRGALRTLLSGAQALDVNYELAPEWPRADGSSWIEQPVTERFRQGLETLDYKRLRGVRQPGGTGLVLTARDSSI